MSTTQAASSTPQNAPDVAQDAAGETANEAYKCPVVLVVGMAGSGKTTLVDTFSMWLENEDEMDDESTPASDAPPGTDNSANTADVNVGSSSNRAPGKVVEDAAADSLKPGGEEKTQIKRSESAQGGQSPDDFLPGDSAYVVNLDPAVLRVPYEANIDIRDTIDYKSVMSEYSLGPNGGILTSLNLYATRFDQVLSLVERRATECRCVLLDTPGQIETFTWSASGTIITESLAQSLPTCVLFVVDVPRASSPMTFVSSMLYACSIMYKTRLPMVICLNKADVAPEKAKEITEWINDFDVFDERLREENSGFVDELARSMALALEEFYAVIKSTIISAHTGTGLKHLAKLIEEAAEEYNAEYKPWMEEQRRIRKEIEEEDAEGQIERLKKDIEADKATITGNGGGGIRHTSFAPKTEEELKEIEEEIAEEERKKAEFRDADPEEVEAYNNFVEYLDKMEIKSEKKTTGE